jgi:hypothetical protein
MDILWHHSATDDIIAADLFAADAATLWNHKSRT